MKSTSLPSDQYQSPRLVSSWCRPIQWYPSSTFKRKATESFSSLLWIDARSLPFAKQKALASSQLFLSEILLNYDYLMLLVSSTQKYFDGHMSYQYASSGVSSILTWLSSRPASILELMSPSGVYIVAKPSG